MTEEDKAIFALIAGFVLIVLNVLIFLFRLISLAGKASSVNSESNFSIPLHLANTYLIQVGISLFIFWLVLTVEAVDEANELNLRDVDGIFWIFWESDIQSLINNAKNIGNESLEATYHNIKTLRDFFEIFISLTIVLFLLGTPISTYFVSKTQDMSSQNSKGTDIFNMVFKMALNTVIVFILIISYSYLTADSLFIRVDNKNRDIMQKYTIMSIYSQWWTSSVDGVVNGTASEISNNNHYLLNQ